MRTLTFHFGLANRKSPLSPNKVVFSIYFIHILHWEMYINFKEANFLWKIVFMDIFVVDTHMCLLEMSKTLI